LTVDHGRWVWCGAASRHGLEKSNPPEMGDLTVERRHVGLEKNQNFWRERWREARFSWLQI
jgi:hypothetical protein